MFGYCGYIENLFDLLQIGERNEWLQYRVLLPLGKIVMDAFDEERIPEDIACLFLSKDTV